MKKHEKVFEYQNRSTVSYSLQETFKRADTIGGIEEMGE